MLNGALGVYHKYDDVIRREPGFLRILSDTVRRSQDVENRKVALEAMLPKWPGFVGGESSEDLQEMTAKDALQEVDLVIQSIRYLRVWEDQDPTPLSWEPQGFSDAIVSKVLVLLHWNVLIVKVSCV